MKKFNVGDKVSFLNEKGEGVVSKILNSTMVEVTIDEGLDIPYRVDELVLIKKAENPKQDVKQSETKPQVQIDEKEISKILFQKNRSELQTKKSKPHNTNKIMEIDLHIHELLDNYKRMSNAEIVNYQLSYFQKKLNEAYKNNYHKLVVIHGVGNGRLKHEVRSLLDSQGIKYYDGSYSKYGFGATEVEL